MEVPFDRLTIAQGGTLVAMVVGAFALWDRWKKSSSEKQFRDFCGQTRSKLIDDSGANAVPVAAAEAAMAMRAVREGLFTWDPYGRSSLLLRVQEDGIDMKPSARPTEAEVPGLKLVYELALKRYEYLDRRFDTIGTRGSAAIGFAIFLVASSSTLVQRLRRPYPELAFTAGILLAALLSYLIYNAFKAYEGRRVEGLPAPEVLFGKLVHESEHEVRLEMVSELGQACDLYSSACESRSQHLKKALVAFVLTMGLVLVGLMVVPEP